MINALDRYILRRIIGIAVAMIGIALLALLLERLLRLLNLAAHPDQILSYVSQMLVTLIPHYLGVATPLAFFLAIVITFNRLDRDKELAVMTAAGIGLQRVMVPVLGLAILLAVVVGITFSHLQPIGRYTYRSLAPKQTQFVSWVTRSPPKKPCVKWAYRVCRVPMGTLGKIRRKISSWQERSDFQSSSRQPVAAEAAACGLYTPKVRY